jgi:hypothetical protein
LPPFGRGFSPSFGGPEEFPPGGEMPRANVSQFRHLSMR